MRAFLLTLLCVLGNLGLMSVSPATKADEFFRDLPDDLRILNGVIVDGVLRRIPAIARVTSVTGSATSKHCAASLLDPVLQGGQVVGWDIRHWPRHSDLASGGDGLVWAVTAAHCVGDFTEVPFAAYAPYQVTIVSGLLHLATWARPGIQQGVDTIILPGAFGTAPFDVGGSRTNDIALLHLKMPTPFAHLDYLVDFSPRSIILSTGLRWSYAPYASAFVAGWGTTENGHGSNVLLEAQLPIVAHDACVQGLGVADPSGAPPGPDTLCAGFSTGEYDSCEGDSGGPLFYAPPIASHSVGRSDGPVLIGIASYGPDCQSAKENYGVYTDISKYDSWLRAEIQKFLEVNH